MKKIRLGTRHMAAALLFIGVTAAAGALVNGSSDPARIPYKYTMEPGDTIYQVASRIATPRDNINELTWQILEDNGIEDPGTVQPGKVITIWVDPANPNLQQEGGEKNE
nr:MAG TPA: LysM domain [Caudoviricetes sp.]